MDQTTTIVIGALISILFTGGLWAWQRRVTNADRAETNTFNGLGVRVTTAEDKINNIMVQLERRVTWDEIGEIKKELKDDMEKVALRMEAAVNSLRRTE